MCSVYMHMTINMHLTIISAQAGKVFEKQRGDFMKDVISTGIYSHVSFTYIYK